MSFRPAMKQEAEEQENRASDSQESLVLLSQDTNQAVALSQGTNDLLSGVMSEAQPVTEAGFEPLDTLEGKYELKVSFRKEEKVTKRCFWTYSGLWNKAYMLMDKMCPFVLSVSRAVPLGSYISAAMFFKRDEDSLSVPARCPSHASPRDPTNYNHDYPGHLLRSDQKTACYVWDHERPRVVVPFPTDGSTCCTFNFKVMCRNSCDGGMARRPTMIVFSLENSRQGILASCSVEVMIFSCPPGGDRLDEEKKESSRLQGQGHKTTTPQTEILQQLKRTFSLSSVTDCVPSKRLKLQEQNTNRSYEIHVNSKRKYRILCGLKSILELLLPPNLP